MGFTNAVELDLLEHFFQGAALADTPSHLALFTVAPGEDGTGGTEVSGGAYARVAVTANGTNWGSGSAGDPSTIENLLEISFAEATANWGTVVAAAYMDASSGGDVLFVFDLGTSKAVDNGDTAKFAAGSLVAKLGNPGDSY